MTIKRSKSVRAITTLVTATVATGVASAALPATASALPTGCADTFNLIIPGTWETREDANPSEPVGMTAPIAQAIKSQQGDRAEVYNLPYMARAFDNGHTYADSKKTAVDGGTAVLRDYAAKCRGTQFTIVGYSQGADAAGDIASAIGNGRGPVSADRVLAVGLISDPGNGTKGETTVGPKTANSGIADPRPDGMGALSGKVASICASEDLYCAANKTSNPVLGALGTILSKSPSTDSGTGTGTTGGDSPGVGNNNSKIATALTSDFSKADLPNMGSAASELIAGLTPQNGTIDLQKVAKSANTLLGSITPLTDLLSSGAGSAATGQLSTAPAGSPENSANQVLTAAGQSDLSGALSTVTSIANTAANLMGANTNTLSTSAPEASQLSSASNGLSTQIAPLSSTPSDVLSSASSVLSVLKPATVVSQALNVVTGVTSLDLAGILANLVLLPQKVAALDAQGAHDVARKLNTQFEPLVKMAANVDLEWISSILSIIPDPTGGYIQIAALVVSILSKVDVVKLANLVGQIQEVAWSVIEKLAPPAGQAPDPVGAGAALTGLLPIGLDLASVATNMLTGTASKTPVELLGKQSNSAVSTITKQAENFDLSGLTNSVASMAQSQGASDLATLVSEGLTAASFFAGGSHTSYGNLVVDNAGRTAIQWMSDWINLQIGRSV
ncbi:cutinase family protein [Nocardia salmonicida]|uniref:cutinase family protein n=1 Tax=Nocardia salmonicida TaxID=53431 RepID=UPI0007A47ECE|nr:cutinase family protein [Nocardia salmonicida]MBC7299784.1 cutinase family protein [Nocardia sp.]